METGPTSRERAIPSRAELARSLGASSVCTIYGGGAGGIVWEYLRADPENVGMVTFYGALTIGATALASHFSSQFSQDWQARRKARKAGN